MMRDILKSIINTRTEIGYETSEGYFIRKRSNYKRELAETLADSFPWSKIGYHITLEGIPPIYAIDLESSRLNDLHLILDYFSMQSWDEAMIFTSGNKGYHLFFKCDKNITLFDMYRFTNRLKIETETAIDLRIYNPNHFIRGPFSINFNSDSKIMFSSIFDRSLPIDENGNPLELNSSKFILKNWNLAKIENSRRYTTSHTKAHTHENFSKDYSPQDNFCPGQSKNYKQYSPQDLEARVKNTIDDINLIIENGVERGLRHDALFCIVSTLNYLKKSKEEILKTALEFNRRCIPPESKRVIKMQVRDIIRKKYDPPSFFWMKKRGLVFF